MKEQCQIFLSYSRTDREACVLLPAALEKAGLSVFRDEESVRGGNRWQDKLHDALQGCSAFVVLIGRAGISGWIGAEIQIALNRHLCNDDADSRLPIPPVLLDGVELSSTERSRSI
jgi:hypothetical protein